MDHKSIARIGYEGFHVLHRLVKDVTLRNWDSTTSDHFVDNPDGPGMNLLPEPPPWSLLPESPPWSLLSGASSPHYHTSAAAGSGRTGFIDPSLYTCSFSGTNFPPLRRRPDARYLDVLILTTQSVEDEEFWRTWRCGGHGGIQDVSRRGGGYGGIQQLSRSCAGYGGIQEVSRRCSGGIQEVCRVWRYPGGIQEVSRRYPGEGVSRGYPGGVQGMEISRRLECDGRLILSLVI
ncbi:unnamed protein product [Boreogadus saida]